ncbi:BglG family transcription antiterminator [Fonticella tunisiensis]|uniref:BglG family transcriptional antiterminator n=1 Tax=Fonticella tunisiensis TaxID=1096341 RepID=A0A4R7KBR2_9CLOT|nr:BglG family transcription antiterminator [Fonticella tunisiensis]TDT51916.1 BglG family transcriptional antiterminator [Fonticella tunisiensis]
MGRFPIDGRQLRILEKAIQNEYNKLEDFAEIIGVSTRTIRNYIKLLNSTLKKEIAQLVNIKDAGYKLEIYDRERFNELINQCLFQQNNLPLLNTPEERLKYIIKRLINSKVPIKIDELANEISVGRTTLINDLKRISEPLSAYGLIIKGKQNEGIELKGNELNIRLFILDFLCKGFITDCTAEYYFGTIDKSRYGEIKNYLVNLFYHDNFLITDETLRELLTYIAVLLRRSKDKRYIESLDKKYEEITTTEEYILAKKIRDKLEKEFNCEINDNEIVFLTLPLLGRKVPINNDRSCNIRISSHVKQLVEKIIEEVSASTGIDMKYDKELMWGLEYHLNFTLNRLIFNIKIKNPLLKDIKNCYPLPYEMAKIAAKVIEKNYNVKVNEDEIGYIALHFGSYIERSNQKLFHIEKVALVCGTGLGTAQLLYVKLRKFLGEDKVFNTFSDIELTRDLLNEYDIVFTTVDINIETETPIIKVNAIFNENEVQKEIERIYYFKKYNLKLFESNLSLLNMTVVEDMFFILDRQTFIDNLMLMVDELWKIGEIDAGFKDRIIEREFKAPTSFDNYVAIPHAINYRGDRISIAVGILKEPVFWGGKEVRIIILLMIPKEDVDPELIIKTYEELLKLCQNKRLIENICRVKSYVEFRKLLQKEIMV